MPNTQSELQKIVEKRNARLIKKKPRRGKAAPPSEPAQVTSSVSPRCAIDAATRSLAIGRRT